MSLFAFALLHGLVSAIIMVVVFFFLCAVLPANLSFLAGILAIIVLGVCFLDFLKRRKNYVDDTHDL